jgi:signal transduction histidine kinase
MVTDSQPNSKPEVPDFSDAIAMVAKINAVPLILEMVKQATGMRFAAVVRVTEKNWVTCAVDDSMDFGLLPGSQLEVESTFCHEIRQNRKPVIFTHASNHPIYSLHHTPKRYKLESYVSFPIVTADGHFFGTLCAIDRVPAKFDEATILKMMELYSQVIAMNLDLQKGLFSSEHALADATESGVMRDQFVAVLGHDLRTPLSAVRMSAELLEARVTNNVRSLKLVRTIRQSSLRMSSLIEDVLDFARGKLGGGIPVKLVFTEDLRDQFEAVLMELRVMHPHAQILEALALSTGVYCDPNRLGQLLSNLVGNAITHGDKGAPIQVRIVTIGEDLVISVHNTGAVIPAHVLPSLFQPFKRPEIGSREDGLGLGLYIAHQICAGHHGTLAVTSDAAQGTEFVATIPCLLK